MSHCQYMVAVRYEAFHPQIREQYCKLCVQWTSTHKQKGKECVLHICVRTLLQNEVIAASYRFRFGLRVKENSTL